MPQNRPQFWLATIRCNHLSCKSNSKPAETRSLTGVLACHSSFKRVLEAQSCNHLSHNSKPAGNTSLTGGLADILMLDTQICCNYFNDNSKPAENVFAHQSTRRPFPSPACARRADPLQPSQPQLNSSRRRVHSRKHWSAKSSTSEFLSCKTGRISCWNGHVCWRWCRGSAARKIQPITQSRQRVHSLKYRSISLKELSAIPENVFFNLCSIGWIGCPLIMRSWKTCSSCRSARGFEPKAHRNYTVR